MAEMNRKTNDGSSSVDNREMDNNRGGVLFLFLKKNDREGE